MIVQGSFCEALVTLALSLREGCQTVHGCASHSGCFGVGGL